MNFKHLFIVTYGRSGSTLLQGILNAYPGIVIRGENSGMLQYLVESYKLYQQEVYRQLPTGLTAPTNPFYGIEDATVHLFGRNVAKCFEDTFLRPGPDTKCIGFKEVRYEYDREVFDSYMDFMLTYFEDACIIFNARNNNDVSRSKWWSDNTEDSLIRIKKYEDNMRNYHTWRPDATYWVNYDNYHRDASALQGLFDFLGVEFDIERTRKTLSVTHSY